MTVKDDDMRKSVDSKPEMAQDEEMIDTSGPEEWLQGFPLIKDKTPEERKAIEKSLVRKLDWKFLPCITMMLLMK